MADEIVSSGVVLSGLNVNTSGTQVNVLSGGTIISGSFMNPVKVNVLNGGVASSATLSDLAIMTLSGGKAVDTVVSGVLTELRVSNGGFASHTTLTGKGELHVSSGGRAVEVGISGGSAFVSSGAVVEEAVVVQSGNQGLLVVKGGMVSNTTVCSGGYLKVSNGGVAQNTEVLSGGSMRLYAGDKHCGKLTIADGATVYVNKGVIDFTVAQQSPEDEFLINNLAAVKGSGITYTITVGDAQAEGQYKLAQGAENFAGTITVGTADDVYGTISVGETVAFGGVDYRLINVSGNLILNIGALNVTVPTINGISASTEELTNKDVVLTVSGSDAGGIYLYSFDGSTWFNGTVVTVTENTTVYFKATDVYGNESEVVSYEVKNIDKVAPTLEISGNATGWTNKDVVLSATANDGMIEYFNGTDWVAGNSITATVNGTYQFRAIDAVGNVAEKSVEVSFIDKDAPVLEISGNATDWTNKDVVLSATANEGVIEYFNGTAWVAGDKITATVNDTYNFRVTDAAGNVTEKSVVVDKIDKVAPTLEISGNATEWTNQDVVLTAKASDGAVEYFNGTAWVAGDKITATVNDTYKFRVTDAAGNVTEKSVVVDKIDKVAPTLEISGNAAEWTNQDVVLTATANEGTVEYYDGKDWVAGNRITATANGTYQFRVTDAAGNITEKSVVVDKIDKVAPTLEISGNAADWTNKDVVLSAKASDGTIEYYNGSKWVAGNSFTATANGTYKFRVTDAAGNVTEKSVTVDKIDKVAPTLEISGNATEWTNQDVVLTAKASDGKVEYFANGKWNSGSSITATVNGTYQFRVTDAVGNVTEKSVVVDKIDKVAPTLDISGNATSWTNKDVVLTAKASDGKVEYFANGKWNTGSSITATANGTYQFRVTDAAGNVTEKSVTVDKIDKVVPKLEISGNATEWTNQDVVLTAKASDGKVEYFANGKWNTGSSITATANGTYQFRVTDAAGNVTEKSVVVDKIDKVAPTLEISGNAAAWTDKDVVLSAKASDGTIEYFNGTAWVAGSSITASTNGTYQFRVTDAAGNVTEKSVVVDKIDKAAPTVPNKVSVAFVGDDVRLGWGASDEGSGVAGYKIRYGNTAQLSGEGIAVSDKTYTLSGLEAGSWFYQICAVDNLGHVSAWSEVKSFEIAALEKVEQQGPTLNFQWGDSTEVSESGYTAKITLPVDAPVAGTLEIKTESNAIDFYAMPSGSYQCQVKDNDTETFCEEAEFEATVVEQTPTNWVAVENGATDVFFANSFEKWQSEYFAQHLGSQGNWFGTKEIVQLEGKNKITDIFSGSNDASILLLSDDANGDALFFDDVYSALGETARLSLIDEIRAGAGNDIVDLSSQRYNSIGNNMTIFGGDGDDIIWANGGNNTLFGDAGNDRLVGANGNDIIIGGAGNDSMHGGGGNDTFCFGANWGNDTVEQLSGGKVTLHFESGSESNWNAKTLTYTDGTNSVTVSGVAEVELVFGETAPVAGAFLDAASKKIFEDDNKGMIA